MKSFLPQEAVVLVGGLGTRLGPLTRDVPKPMLLVAGRPFLEYFLLRLKNEGIRRVALAVAYHSQVIKNYFGDGRRLGLEIFYSDPEGRQLGTGGSIKEAENLIHGKQFFAMNGDVYFEAPLDRLWREHCRGAHEITLALASAADSGRYGRVRLDGQGRVASFLEKSATASPGPCLINGGIYVFQRQVLERIPSGVDYSLERDLFPVLAGRSLGGAAFPEAFFIDIGTPEDYDRANRELPMRLKEKGYAGQ